MKNFDVWNTVKKGIETEGRILYARPREIWWCSIGVNIGAEVDGKHVNFERPVIVMKVYNTETLIILPLTSKPQRNRFHHEITLEVKKVWVALTQCRVISSKRLLRKMFVVSEDVFQNLKEIWKTSL